MSQAPKSDRELIKEVRASAAPFVRDRRRTGLIVAVAFFGVLLAWSILAPLSVGAIAPGFIVVKGGSMPIRHPEGGIVRQVHVANGDRVQAGELLLELDDVAAAARLGDMEAKLVAITARLERLGAERESRETVSFGVVPLSVTDDALRDQIIGQERAQFAARMHSYAGERAVVAKQFAAATTANRVFAEQMAKIARQIRLIQEEVDAKKELQAKGFVPRSEVLNLERQQEGLAIEHLNLEARSADAAVKLAEAEKNFAGYELGRLAGIDAEMEEARLKSAEVGGMAAIARAAYERTRVRAPAAGRVMNLVAGVGAGQLVEAGALIATIVPDGGGLRVSAQLAPADSAYIRAGLPAFITVTAFSSRETGALDGRVSYVSPDVQQDRPDTPPYYALEITIDPASIAELSPGVLQPGMPVQISIETVKRPIIVYLVDPLLGSFRRAFREN